MSQFTARSEGAACQQFQSLSLSLPARLPLPAFFPCIVQRRDGAVHGMQSGTVHLSLPSSTNHLHHSHSWQIFIATKLTFFVRFPIRNSCDLRGCDMTASRTGGQVTGNLKSREQNGVGSGAGRHELTTTGRWTGGAEGEVTCVTGSFTSSCNWAAGRLASCGP
jgi:hypothetical protein